MEVMFFLGGGITSDRFKLMWQHRQTAIPFGSIWDYIWDYKPSQKLGGTGPAIKWHVDIADMEHQPTRNHSTWGVHYRRVFHVSMYACRKATGCLQYVCSWTVTMLTVYTPWQKSCQKSAIPLPNSMVLICFNAPCIDPDFAGKPTILWWYQIKHENINQWIGFRTQNLPETVDFPMKYGDFAVNCPLNQSIDLNDARWG